MGLYNVGFAGQAGGEFAERQMEQILKQRMFAEEQARMRAAQEQQAAAEQARMALDQERFTEGKRQFEVGEARLTANDAADQAAKDAEARAWLENLSAIPDPALQRLAEAERAGIKGTTRHDYEAADVHAAELAEDERRRLLGIEQEADIKGRIALKYHPKPQGPTFNPIFVTRNGQTVRIRSESEIQPGDEPYSAAAKGAGGGKLSATLTERVAGARASAQSLGRLEHLMKPESEGGWGASRYIGPLAGRAETWKQDLPGFEVNPTFSKFAAESAALKNAIIKAFTGAQMSEPEAIRIAQQIPGVNDKPGVWAEKAAATRQNLLDAENAIYDVSGVERGIADPVFPAEKLLQKLLGGESASSGQSKKSNYTFVK